MCALAAAFCRDWCWKKKAVAPLQERPVEKQRHQEPLCRENQQSGGNPRNTFSTGCEPKELATVSRISGTTDPYKKNDAQKEFGDEVHRAPITEEVKEFGRNWDTQVYRPDSKISETSYFQSHMHFDDSVESIADADLEDGELQKMLTAPAKPDALFSSEQGNLIRRSVFRNANPSNLRGSLLEGNKDHLPNQSRSDLAQQELHVESLNKCISELQRQMEEQRLALQDTQYNFVESRREQIRLQEELSMKEKVLRYTHVRNMHEMGEIKRAQDQRID